jgi:hypothetical protein
MMPIISRSLKPHVSLNTTTFLKKSIYNARSNGPQSEMNKEKREAKQLAREDGTFSGFFF